MPNPPIKEPSSGLEQPGGPDIAIHIDVPRRLRLEIATFITLDSFLADPCYIFEGQDQSWFLQATTSDALNDPSRA